MNTCDASPPASDLCGALWRASLRLFLLALHRLLPWEASAEHRKKVHACRPAPGPARSRCRACRRGCERVPDRQYMPGTARYTQHVNRRAEHTQRQGVGVGVRMAMCSDAGAAYMLRTTPPTTHPPRLSARVCASSPHSLAETRSHEAGLGQAHRAPSPHLQQQQQQQPSLLPLKQAQSHDRLASPALTLSPLLVLLMDGAWHHGCSQ